MLATASVAPMSMATTANAATAEDLNRDSQQALNNLYKTNTLAEKLSHSAKAVLVFPNIIKAGLVFGGSYGEGELLEDAKVKDYYNSVSGSWGLQASPSAGRNKPTLTASDPKWGVPKFPKRDDPDKSPEMRPCGRKERGCLGSHYRANAP